MDRVDDGNTPSFRFIPPPVECEGRWVWRHLRVDREGRTRVVSVEPIKCGLLVPYRGEMFMKRGYMEDPAFSLEGELYDMSTGLAGDKPMDIVMDANPGMHMCRGDYCIAGMVRAAAKDDPAFNAIAVTLSRAQLEALPNYTAFMHGTSVCLLIYKDVAANEEIVCRYSAKGGAVPDGGQAARAWYYLHKNASEPIPVENAEAEPAVAAVTEEPTNNAEVTQPEPQAALPSEKLAETDELVEAARKAAALRLELMTRVAENAATAAVNAATALRLKLASEAAAKAAAAAVADAAVAEAHAREFMRTRLNAAATAESGLLVRMPTKETMVQAAIDMTAWGGLGPARLLPCGDYWFGYTLGMTYGDFKAYQRSSFMFGRSDEVDRRTQVPIIDVYSLRRNQTLLWNTKAGWVHAVVVGTTEDGDVRVYVPQQSRVVDLARGAFLSSDWLLMVDKERNTDGGAPIPATMWA